MRNGEIITAGVLSLLSIYLMWKSMELPIGYIKGQGPGGGAWPFWLSLVMLICCGMTAIRWRRGTSPASQSDEPVLDAYGWQMLRLVGGGIVVFVALINVISMYGAIMAFLVYYIRYLGRHSWLMTLAIAIAVPILFFFFFEGAMRITMPTGMPFTDPVFNILYEIIY